MSTSSHESVAPVSGALQFAGEDISNIFAVKRINSYMPTCPECGHTESTVTKWFSSAEDATLEMGSVLIVCPSCDAVLGGGRYVSS